MAPSIRLRTDPEKAIMYTSDSGLGSSGISTAHKNSLGPNNSIRPQSTISQLEMTAEILARERTPRVKDGVVAKAKALTKKIVKPAAKAKKERPVRKECSICCIEKTTRHSFKLVQNIEICEHFKTICGRCIQKMLRAKVTNHHLTESDLACPFPNCDYLLAYAQLKKAVPKTSFEEYDKAVTKHTLTTNSVYVACLDPACGLYLSVEDCKGQKRGKFKAACPYCKYEMCLTCNRPWKLHSSGSCSDVNKTEEKNSLAEMQKMGVKTCPKCGAHIQKDAGCDHMTCRKCRHNSCWQCLVPYTLNIQHLPSCTHARTHVADDAAAWVHDNMTIDQIYNLFRRNADSGFSAPRVEQPLVHLAPAPAHRPPGNHAAAAGPQFVPALWHPTPHRFPMGFDQGIDLATMGRSGGGGIADGVPPGPHQWEHVDLV